MNFKANAFPRSKRFRVLIRSNPNNKETKAQLPLKTKENLVDEKNPGLLEFSDAKSSNSTKKRRRIEKTPYTF